MPPLSHLLTPIHTCRAELLHPDDLPASHPLTPVHTCRAELLHPDDLPAYTKMYKGHVTQRQVGGTQGSYTAAVGVATRTNL